jgi:hypothetical protein
MHHQHQEKPFRTSVEQLGVQNDIYMLYKLYNLYRFTRNVSPWAMALASPYRAESKPILVAKIACYS